ncbi:PqiC family protein [Brenneria corticis]|uniref:ABC-type transport auxiliary lipoprotein component domain-containing protein n=1 Tax=Brenneria corticis TaxID=2173106 RepID=A0A2U1U317_9GAMM|nr:PqiC family protein [Brenneria sp. CFCC 11842]PWC16051.1 hypothetical protein DDT56_11110 [Brenneria sp. CFCC 11842]
MTASIRRALLAGVLLLAGCVVSTSPRYYTLLSPQTDTAAAAAPAPFAIAVLPVGVPVQIDQPQLVVRRGDSGLAVLDDARWLSPLSDEIRAALSSELIQRLGAQDVSGLARQEGKPVVKIHLQVRRFDVWPNQYVKFAADWSLGFADRPRLVCGSQLTENTAGGEADTVLAQQRVIARLAAQIAANVRNQTAGRQDGCI